MEISGVDTDSAICHNGFCQFGICQTTYPIKETIMSKIIAKHFVHRTTITQASVIKIIEALEEYAASSGKLETYKEELHKFHMLAVKGDSEYAKPAYEKKGRESVRITTDSLGLEDEVAKFEKENAEWMREMERTSALNGNPTVDKRTVDIIPDVYKRRDDPVDNDSEAASSFFSDVDKY